MTDPSESICSPWKGHKIRILPPRGQSWRSRCRHPSPALNPSPRKCGGGGGCSAYLGGLDTVIYSFREFIESDLIEVLARRVAGTQEHIWAHLGSRDLASSRDGS